MKKTIIKTKNFSIRFFEKGDEFALVKNLNNKKISKTLTAVPYPYIIKYAKDFILKNLIEYKKKNPQNLIFAIENKGKIIGAVGLYSIKNKHKAKLGYWLKENYWGQGIMTKVVKSISSFAFKKFKLKRLYAYVFSFNPASKRVLEKNGFVVEGFLKKHIKKGKKYIDCYLLTKIR